MAVLAHAMLEHMLLFYQEVTSMCLNTLKMEQDSIWKLNIINFFLLASIFILLTKLSHV